MAQGTYFLSKLQSFQFLLSRLVEIAKKAKTNKLKYHKIVCFGNPKKTFESQKKRLKTLWVESWILCSYKKKIIHG